MNPSIRQLIITLLWSESDGSTPSGGEPFDKNYEPEDVDKKSIDELQAVFSAFVNKAEDVIRKLRGDNWSSIDEFYTGPVNPESPHHQFEHDFILTVNHHGAGFWEKSDWPEDIGKELTRLAHQEKEIHLFLHDGGDDGEVGIEFG